MMQILKLQMTRPQCGRLKICQRVPHSLWGNNLCKVSATRMEMCLLRLIGPYSPDANNFSVEFQWRLNSCNLTKSKELYTHWIRNSECANRNSSLAMKWHQLSETSSVVPLQQKMWLLVHLSSSTPTLLINAKTYPLMMRKSFKKSKNPKSSPRKAKKIHHFLSYLQMNSSIHVLILHQWAMCRSIMTSSKPNLLHREKRDQFWKVSQNLRFALSFAYQSRILVNSWQMKRNNT